MKISASIYASQQKDLQTLVPELDALHVDYFHLDCNDDPRVFDDIPTIRKLTQTPLDVHIISQNPSAYFGLIEKYRPERVAFQLEAFPPGFQLPQIAGVNMGVAITTPTPIASFSPFVSTADYLLVMATTPGQSGGKFDAENFKKIREFNRLFPGKEVEVDGGVNDEVSFVLRTYGVQVAVVGSFLMNHEVQGRALSLLKHEPIESHYRVGDIMLLPSYLPVLKSHDCTFLDIVAANEKYSLGYVLFEDERGKFAGISTNADIRRGLLKHPQDFNSVNAQDAINPSPLVVREDQTIQEMFQLLRSKKQSIISYLPVVNAQGQLAGAVNFNTLIKGEL